jgi:hypothetical protein
VAATYNHEAALQHVAAVSTGTTPVVWRLPNIKELASIIDISQFNPAIDTAVFPATPVNHTWAATPSVTLVNYAWGVTFHDGYINVNALRNLGGAVRLVRSGQ